MNTIQIPAGMATCPKCNGSGRVTVPESDRGPNLRWRYGYRESDNTLPCNNCGGQTMSLQPQGFTKIDPATGQGCLHSYVGRNAGRCYTEHNCIKCGHSYSIDSSD